MKTILFPTDFSENAFHASRYAAMLSKKLNANIVLLNIYSVPMVSEFQLPQDIEVFLAQNKNKAYDKLKKFYREFLEETGLGIDKVSLQLEYGFIPEKITETAKSIKADLIVMGTKGANNPIDRWLGTVAQKVMKLSTCPVWIIPEKAPLHFPDEILYAADFKEDEVIATQTLMKIVNALKAKCKAIHIHDYFELNVGHQIEAMVDYLEDTFEAENIHFSQLKRAEIIEGLEQYIKNQKPDVLALAVHEKSLFDQLFDTSVTKHFVQGAKLPLLTFRK